MILVGGVAAPILLVWVGNSAIRRKIANDPRPAEEVTAEIAELTSTFIGILYWSIPMAALLAVAMVPRYGLWGAFWTAAAWIVGTWLLATRRQPARTVAGPGASDAGWFAIWCVLVLPFVGPLFIIGFLIVDAEPTIGIAMIAFASAVTLFAAIAGWQIGKDP